MCACAGIPVLLVDEDPIFREALAENLRIDGHEVFECPTAHDAVPAMRARTFVAMVTEYVVPGSNGVRLADEFRALDTVEDVGGVGLLFPKDEPQKKLLLEQTRRTLGESEITP